MALQTNLPLMNTSPDAAGNLTRGLGLGANLAQMRQQSQARQMQMDEARKEARQKDMITAFTLANDYDPLSASGASPQDNYLRVIGQLKDAGVEVDEDDLTYTPENAMQLRNAIDAGGKLMARDQAAGDQSPFQWGASYVVTEKEKTPEGERDVSYIVSDRRDPNTGITSLSKTRITGELTDKLGLTADAKAELDVKTAGDKVSAETQAEIDTKTIQDNVERVAAAEARIASLAETAKLKARDAALLRSTETIRQYNIQKAKSFLEGFKSGDRKSGVGRKVSNYLPIGVWTEQGEFDELLDSFAEVAAREKLKASGELRPTDADVQGMKNAMFGVGRDEQTNIQLLEEYIAEQEALSGNLADFDNSEAERAQTQKDRDRLSNQFQSGGTQDRKAELDERAQRLLGDAP